MTQNLSKNVIADFETQLAAKILVGGTTGTLVSATDDDGVALPTGRYFLTIDRTNSKKEFISCTLTGTALTNIKSVSRQGVETAGTVREHRVGANVIISDYASLAKINDVLTGVINLDSGTPLGYDGAPSITTGNQLATKTYVDTSIATPDAQNVKLTGNQTVAGIKTFSSSPIVPTPTTATQAANKSYVDGVAVAGAPDASTTVKGIVEEATQAEITAATAAGSTGARLFINPNTFMDSATGKVKSTFLPASMIESWKNETITNSRSISMIKNTYSDSTTALIRMTAFSTNFYYHDNSVTGGYQTRDVAADWASATSINSAVVIGSFVYVLLLQAGTAYRVYRYSTSNIAAGGTLITFSGQSLAWNNDEQVMSANSTTLYFNHKAGASSNSYVLSKYTVSGTTFTYTTDVTCGSTAGDGFRIVDIASGGDIYLVNSSGVIKRFNSSGVLQYTYLVVSNNTATWHSQASLLYMGTVVSDNLASNHFGGQRFYQ